MKEFVYTLVLSTAVFTAFYLWFNDQKEKGDKIIQTIPVTVQHEGDPAAITLTLELRANRTVTWTNK